MDHRKRPHLKPLRKFELLEPRQMLSATANDAAEIMYPEIKLTPHAVGSTAPAGLTPAQIRGAYGLDINGKSITFGGVKADGTGQTIAIVDAYDNPEIMANLTAFDKQFGIADPKMNAFKVVNSSGGTTLPTPDTGWAGEIALDVEWAHAIAPGANILLVEATTSALPDLLAAVDYARSQTGVVVVSNSWGGPELSTEAANDSYFTTPGGHAGITFTVSAGDTGAPAAYPSSSPNVLSVGGTTLTTNGNNYGSESVWAGGGGGASKYEHAPSYQKSIGLKTRGTPDVAFNADPLSGVAVYDGFNYTQTGKWNPTAVGGTSFGAPVWAALIAIVDQGRARLGKDSLSNAQAALYSLPRADFHDITTGSNGNLASAGYDLASGLGSPKANLVIPALVAWTGSTTLPTATVPGAAKGGWWWATYFGDTAGGESVSSASASISVPAVITTSIDDVGSPFDPGAANDGTTIAAPTFESPNVSSDAVSLFVQGLRDDSPALSRRRSFGRQVDGDAGNAALDDCFAQIGYAAESSALVRSN